MSVHSSAMSLPAMTNRLGGQKRKLRRGVHSPPHLSPGRVEASPVQMSGFQSVMPAVGSHAPKCDEDPDKSAWADIMDSDDVLNIMSRDSGSVVSFDAAGILPDAEQTCHRSRSEVKRSSRLCVPAARGAEYEKHIPKQFITTGFIAHTNDSVSAPWLSSNNPAKLERKPGFAEDANSIEQSLRDMMTVKNTFVDLLEEPEGDNTSRRRSCSIPANWRVSVPGSAESGCCTITCGEAFVVGDACDLSDVSTSAGISSDSSPSDDDQKSPCAARGNIRDQNNNVEGEEGYHVHTDPTKMPIKDRRPKELPAQSNRFLAAAPIQTPGKGPPFVVKGKRRPRRSTAAVSRLNALDLCFSIPLK